MAQAKTTSRQGGSRQAASSRGKKVAGAAGRAKLPLVAGTAAIAGATGGAVLGAKRARRRRKLDSRKLAHAAKEVGSFGTQLGQLASELQHAREGANGNTHRSPIEVVLEGLTARRERA
jgi:hypothetical protein